MRGVRINLSLLIVQKCVLRVCERKRLSVLGGKLQNMDFTGNLLLSHDANGLYIGLDYPYNERLKFLYFFNISTKEQAVLKYIFLVMFYSF